MLTYLNLSLIRELKLFNQVATDILDIDILDIIDIVLTT